jgi:hypothetical protein
VHNYLSLPDFSISLFLFSLTHWLRSALTYVTLCQGQRKCVFLFPPMHFSELECLSPRITHMHARQLESSRTTSYSLCPPSCVPCGVIGTVGKKEIKPKNTKRKLFYMKISLSLRRLGGGGISETRYNNLFFFFGPCLSRRTYSLALSVSLDRLCWLSHGVFTSTPLGDGILKSSAFLELQ